MQEHPGYKIYSELLDDQRRMRVREIVGLEADSLDSLICLGGKKNELAGVQFAAGLPELLIGELHAEIKEILTELRGDEDED